MTYQEKLKDPRWQKKRLEILTRDGWRCTHCYREDRPLHVHHPFYIKNKDPWEYSNPFLFTLCEDCHNDPRIHEELLARIMSLPGVILSKKIDLSFVSDIAYAFSKSKLIDDPGRFYELITKVEALIEEYNEMV